jgi:sugar phosphate isomerase/epimerase
MSFKSDCDIFNVSFSTMWSIENFPSLNDFFQASRVYGFDKIELNHQVNSSMLASAHLGAYKFSSVHEPCPADISTETLKRKDWLISSQDEDCRRQGIRAIQRSIDLAHELGAELVVVHSGCIRTDLSGEEQLRKLFLAGELQSPQYQDLKESLVETRARLASPHLEAVKKSLQELTEYAGQRHIRLGVENRYHYFDIPSLDEMELCLDLVDHGQGGWVFDTGHAFALDQLGFFPQEEWLKRYAGQMVASHLHDAIGVHDHLSPGLGEIDFHMVRSFLPQDAIRTCELRTTNTPEQVRAGIQYLYEKGCVTCQ